VVYEERRAIAIRLRIADFQYRLDHNLDFKISFTEINCEEVVKYLNQNVISLTGLKGIWFYLFTGFKSESEQF
jgi:hypothetical protein